ncbi:MAG: hypothetical protein R3C49_07690 [Planctomycetaceae bacterium]
MLFWIREIAGWLLVVLSLIMVRLATTYVASPESPRIVEASVVMFGAMVILRMGILLIRISTAARICLAEQTRVENKKN